MASSRACFSSLPVELKANILERVASQEETWKLRISDLDVDERAREKKAHVDGLQAASLVCKEWNSLANAFIFELLTLKGIQAPLFRHGILGSHGHQITKVQLLQPDDGDDDGDEDDEDSQYSKSTNILDYALSILSLLPNLRSLKINDIATYHLFGTDLDLDTRSNDLKGMRSTTLTQVAARVDDLHLVRFSPSEARRVLELWPQIRRLRLGELTVVEEDADKNDISKAITGLSRLEHLDIQLVGDSSVPVISWTPEVLTALRSSPPPLTFLRLRRMDLPAPPPPLHFPHLTSLHITINDPTSPFSTSNILPAFYTSPLARLIVEDETCTINLDEQCPLTLLGKHFPTLRQIYMAPVEATEVSAVAKFCAGRDLPPPTDTPFDSPFYSRGISAHENGMILLAMMDHDLQESIDE
ncbi:hypothetical protein RQP46_005828 [Phenoliferia psychrophenolica]